MQRTISEELNQHIETVNLVKDQLFPLIEEVAQILVTTIKNNKKIRAVFIVVRSYIVFNFESKKHKHVRCGRNFWTKQDDN